MSPMPLHVGWQEIALRLALTLVCATLFGLNRETHGGAAGLRTTILVCLAASVAMIQANLLLPTVGRAGDAFVTLDLMRLPLGILSGIGFLGGGVIFRRRDLVTGVTTAAILWTATVIGLCIGGGQLALGIAATLIGATTLWGLKRLEGYISHEFHASLILKTTADGPSHEEVARMLGEVGFHIAGEAVHQREGERNMHYNVRWRARRMDPRPPMFVAALAATKGVVDVRWRPPGFEQP